MFRKLLNVAVLTAMVATVLPVTAFADIFGPTVVLSNNINGRTAVRDADNVVITATFADVDGLAGTPSITITSSVEGINSLMSPTADPMVWTYPWNVPAGDSAAYISITASDTVGNASQNPTGPTIYTIDNTAPVLTINTLSTTDTTPELTGTTSDSVAMFVVKVNNVNYSNSINGANTIGTLGNVWTLADNKIAQLAVGAYDVIVTATDAAGNVGTIGNAGAPFELTITQPALTVSTYTVAPATGFDPSLSGENEDLLINYNISETPDSVTVDIKNSSGDLLKSFVSSLKTTQFSWNGEFGGKLVEPGTYKVILSVAKSGYATVTQEKTTVVEYGSVSKPKISSYTVLPESFNPADEDTVVQFTNDEASALTLEIRDANGKTVRAFTGFRNDSFVANDKHSVSWDGTNDSGSRVSSGTYKVVVVVRNNYGVSVYQKDVVVTSTSSTPSSNSHISGIDLSPSSRFEPAEDEELTIEYDVLKDLDELKIYAVRGLTQVELLSETDVSEENNLEITWDGTAEDGEYAVAGTWRIEFRSKIGSDSLKASKSIEVSYVKPVVEDLYVSKEKFDNERDEFTYVLFNVNNDALVDVNVYLGTNNDEAVIEDMEVLEDKWYAVQFEGDGYEYDDSLSLEVVAKNKVNEDIYSTKKISIDLAEDDVSSNKSNVTNDYISPVVTTGNEEMELYYDLDEEADVVITIHKGKSASGTKMIELVNVDAQEAGSHIITWDGKDDDGDKLANGIYTYKIISDKTSTDTETGYFVVGSVGEIEGDASGTGTSTGSTTGKVSPNVIVDGGGKTSSEKCAGFTDVAANSSYCEAITWTKDSGIFQGYGDGTFGLYTPISRSEVLKVVLEAVSAIVNESDMSSYGLGFIDVVDGAWYIPYMRTGKYLGVFTGDGGSKRTARPYDDVSRAEVLKLAFESARVASGYAVSTCSYTNYTDVLSSNWYFKYACEADAYGLFGGGSSLNPNIPAMRGEVASVLYELHLSGVL